MNKKNIFIISTAIIIAVIDQLTKFLARQNLQLNESIPIIKNIFHLTYITNTGSAFGMFQGFNLLFIIFSIIVIIILSNHLKKIKPNERYLQFAVSLLLGGTIGNLLDRIFYGAVIDFIDLRVWPVFNIADSAVTISILFLIILLWKK